MTDRAKDRLSEILKVGADELREAFELGYAKGRADENEACAKLAEQSPSQPGAIIYVDEVRLKEPFVTTQEMGDHIARRIRSRMSGERNGEGK